MKSALVGTGAIARQHLCCLSRLDGVELAGVCDLSRASAEWAAERYGASAWFVDHREMLDRVQPDVVHITTPVTSHHLLATDALEAGAHVIVEKPITAHDHELESLLGQASDAGRSVLEDYNYLFNPPMQDLLQLIHGGALGDVVHADVTFCSDILGAGSPFTDPAVPHPALTLPGGPIGDFATHIAALGHAVVGPHRDLHVSWSDGDRSDGLVTDLIALVEADGGTATLRFSARAQPQTFLVRVCGTRVSATAPIFGRRLVLEQEPTWRRPLVMVRRGMAASVDATVNSLAGPWERLSGGPGAYVGIWILIERTYRALRNGEPVPVSHEQIRAVNRLRSDILSREGRR